MSKIALCVIMKSLPGQRDDLKDLWEQHVKSHAEADENVEFSCYTYSNDDPDTICLFEILADPVKLKESMEAEWLLKYREALQPLMAASPVVFTADPIWAKGISID